MSEGPNKPAVEIAFRTDPGRDPDKQVNEDAAAWIDTPLGLLGVVCDGMGGHAGGKEASNLALRTILDLVKNASPGVSGRDALKGAIEEASRRVYAMSTAEHGFRPGSTVVAVLVHEGGAEIAHVGDSRIYLIHAGAIAQITKDHSMVQEMVDRNLIRAEDAPNHPDANKILRALGIAKECDVDLRPETIAFVAGDVFVLCSDGLSDLVGPAEILDVAGSKPAQQAAGQLVDLANARGGHDNVTVMVMRMKASAVVSDARTIVKTVQLTQHLEAKAADKGSGPRGTVVEAPLGAAAAAAPPNARGAPMMSAGASPVSSPQVAVSPAAALRPAPAAPAPPSEREPRSLAPIVIGIGLTLVALGIAAGIVWATTMRRQHVTVPLLEAGAHDAAAPVEEDASAPEITPAPTLAPPSSSASGRAWADGGASRAPELADCDRARAAALKGAPASVVERLEARCRAAGGKP